VRIDRFGRLRSIANAILGKVPGKPDRLDTATRMAMEAHFNDRSEPTTPIREPRRKVDRTGKLERPRGKGNRCDAS
jgi:hypothetical protein